MSDAMCTGKTKFGSFVEATRKARKSRLKQHEALRPYHCRGCGGWHFGHATSAANSHHTKDYKYRRAQLVFKESA